MDFHRNYIFVMISNVLTGHVAFHCINITINISINMNLNGPMQTSVPIANLPG
jgi:hypothetical protein